MELITKTSNRVPASALILTVILTLVFSLICGAVVLMGYFTNSVQSDSIIKQKLARNMESATNLVLGNPAVGEDQSETMDLFGEGGDSVSITKGHWGVFNYAAINSHFGRFSLKRNFLYGGELPAYMDACIVMADHRRALSLVGDTRLVGAAYLSAGGLRTSYIDQRGFSRVRLIEGQVKTHSGPLPALDNNVITYLKKLLTNPSLSATDFLPLSEAYAQSFADTSLHFFSTEQLVLNRVKLSGKIIISSDKAIEITEDANLSDVILVAPVIRFKSGFKGRVQAIANDSLTIESNCILEYPSALVLLKSKTGESTGYTEIGKNSEVNGVVLTYSEEKEIPKTYTQIEKKARISGIVYTEGYLCLKGDVSGCVLTDYFMYKSPSTIYENYLVDVEINRQDLSGYYIGATVFSGLTGQNIIEWVH